MVLFQGNGHQLDDGSFSIYVGENDIRAIYDEENAAITFFCRYQRDMNFYDKKLMAFATKHGIETKSCTVTSEY